MNESPREMNFFFLEKTLLESHFSQPSLHWNQITIDPEVYPLYLINDDASLYDIFLHGSVQPQFISHKTINKFVHFQSNNGSHIGITVSGDIVIWSLRLQCFLTISNAPILHYLEHCDEEKLEVLSKVKVEAATDLSSVSLLLPNQKLFFWSSTANDSIHAYTGRFGPYSILSLPGKWSLLSDFHSSIYLEIPSLCSHRFLYLPNNRCLFLSTYLFTLSSIPLSVLHLFQNASFSYLKDDKNIAFFLMEVFSRPEGKVPVLEGFFHFFSDISPLPFDVSRLQIIAPQPGTAAQWGFTPCAVLLRGEESCSLLSVPLPLKEMFLSCHSPLPKELSLNLYEHNLSAQFDVRDSFWTCGERQRPALVIVGKSGVKCFSPELEELPSRFIGDSVTEGRETVAVAVTEKRGRTRMAILEKGEDFSISSFDLYEGSKEEETGIDGEKINIEKKEEWKASEGKEENNRRADHWEMKKANLERTALTLRDVALWGVERENRGKRGFEAGKEIWRWMESREEYTFSPTASASPSLSSRSSLSLLSSFSHRYYLYGYSITSKKQMCQLLEATNLSFSIIDGLFFSYLSLLTTPATSSSNASLSTCLPPLISWAVYLHGICEGMYHSAFLDWGNVYHIRYITLIYPKTLWLLREKALSLLSLCVEHFSILGRESTPPSEESQSETVSTVPAQPVASRSQLFTVLLKLLDVFLHTSSPCTIAGEDQKNAGEVDKQGDLQREREGEEFVEDYSKLTSIIEQFDSIYLELVGEKEDEREYQIQYCNTLLLICVGYLFKRQIFLPLDDAALSNSYTMKLQGMEVMNEIQDKRKSAGTAIVESMGEGSFVGNGVKNWRSFMLFLYGEGVLECSELFEYCSSKIPECYPYIKDYLNERSAMESKIQEESRREEEEKRQKNAEITEKYCTVSTVIFYSWKSLWKLVQSSSEGTAVEFNVTRLLSWVLCLAENWLIEIEEMDEQERTADKKEEEDKEERKRGVMSLRSELRHFFLDVESLLSILPNDKDFLIGETKKKQWRGKSNFFQLFVYQKSVEAISALKLLTILSVVKTLGEHSLPAYLPYRLSSSSQCSPALASPPPHPLKRSLQSTPCNIYDPQEAICRVLMENELPLDDVTSLVLHMTQNTLETLETRREHNERNAKGCIQMIDLCIQYASEKKLYEKEKNNETEVRREAFLYVSSPLSLMKDFLSEISLLLSSDFSIAALLYFLDIRLQLSKSIQPFASKIHIYFDEKDIEDYRESWIGSLWESYNSREKKKGYGESVLALAEFVHYKDNKSSASEQLQTHSFLARWKEEMSNGRVSKNVTVLKDKRKTTASRLEGIFDILVNFFTSGERDDTSPLEENLPKGVWSMLEGQKVEKAMKKHSIALILYLLLLKDFSPIEMLNFYNLGANIYVARSKESEDIGEQKESKKMISFDSLLYFSYFCLNNKLESVLDTFLHHLTIEETKKEGEYVLPITSILLSRNEYQSLRSLFTFDVSSFQNLSSPSSPTSSSALSNDYLSSSYSPVTNTPICHFVRRIVNGMMETENPSFTTLMSFLLQEQKVLSISASPYVELTPLHLHQALTALGRERIKEEGFAPEQMSILSWQTLTLTCETWHNHFISPVTENGVPWPGSTQYWVDMIESMDENVEKRYLGPGAGEKEVMQEIGAVEVAQNRDTKKKRLIAEEMISQIRQTILSQMVGEALYQKQRVLIYWNPFVKEERLRKWQDLSESEGGERNHISLVLSEANLTIIKNNLAPLAPSLPIPILSSNHEKKSLDSPNPSSTVVAQRAILTLSHVEVSLQSIEKALQTILLNSFSYTSLMSLYNLACEQQYLSIISSPVKLHSADSFLSYCDQVSIPIFNQKIQCNILSKFQTISANVSPVTPISPISSLWGKIIRSVERSTSHASPTDHTQQKNAILEYSLLRSFDKDFSFDALHQQNIWSLSPIKDSINDLLCFFFMTSQLYDGATKDLLHDSFFSSLLASIEATLSRVCKENQEDKINDNSLKGGDEAHWGKGDNGVKKFLAVVSKLEQVEATRKRIVSLLYELHLHQKAILCIVKCFSLISISPPPSPSISLANEVISLIMLSIIYSLRLVQCSHSSMSPTSLLHPLLKSITPLLSHKLLILPPSFSNQAKGAIWMVSNQLKLFYGIHSPPNSIKSVLHFLEEKKLLCGVTHILSFCQSAKTKLTLRSQEEQQEVDGREKTVESRKNVTMDQIVTIEECMKGKKRQDDSSRLRTYLHRMELELKDFFTPMQRKKLTLSLSPDKESMAFSLYTYWKNVFPAKLLLQVLHFLIAPGDIRPLIMREQSNMSPVLSSLSSLLSDKFLENHKLLLFFSLEFLVASLQSITRQSVFDTKMKKLMQFKAEGEEKTRVKKMEDSKKEEETPQKVGSQDVITDCLHNAFFSHIYSLSKETIKHDCSNYNEYNGRSYGAVYLRTLVQSYCLLAQNNDLKEGLVNYVLVLLHLYRQRDYLMMSDMSKKKKAQGLDCFLEWYYESREAVIAAGSEECYSPYREGSPSHFDGVSVLYDGDSPLYRNQGQTNLRESPSRLGSNEDTVHSVLHSPVKSVLSYHESTGFRKCNYEGSSTDPTTVFALANCDITTEENPYILHNMEADTLAAIEQYNALPDVIIDSRSNLRQDSSSPFN